MGGTALPDRGRLVEMTIAALDAHLAEQEREISRLRAIRETTTYRLEQAIKERDRLVRATALLVDAARLEEGLPGEIRVVRSVTCVEDALQTLAGEAEGAEET